MHEYLTIDIGGTEIKYGLIDKNGILTEKYHKDTQAYLGGKAVQEKVFELVDHYKNRIEGVGISTTGIVDTEAGCILYAGETMPEYTGIDYKKSILEKFHLRCEVENDVNCAGLAESIAGAGKNSSSMICLTIGTGIGGCAVIDRHILHGFSYSGMEVGHMHMHGTSFEKLASASALVKAVADEKNEDISFWNGKRVFDQAEAKDEICIRRIDEMCMYLGEGIANICYVINPETIVLGGGITARSSYLYPRICSALHDHMIPTIHAELKFAETGNDAGMIGAYYHYRNMEQ